MKTYTLLAYESVEIPLDSLRNLSEILLQPRIIPMPGLTVQAQKEALEIEKDLPQAVSALHFDDFEMRGFTDVGDLLYSDHSVQVEEEISGKKTIEIRGGNADEVIVMYNGIQMNSAFDDIYNVSLIDLEDVQRVDPHRIRDIHTRPSWPYQYIGIFDAGVALVDDAPVHGEPGEVAGDCRVVRSH